MEYNQRKKVGDKTEGEVAKLYIDYGPQNQLKYDSVSGMKKWNPDYYMMEEWMRLVKKCNKSPDFYFSKLNIYVDVKKSIKILKKNNLEHYRKMGELGGLPTYLMVKQENRGFCMINLEDLYREIIPNVVWNDDIDMFIDVNGGIIGEIKEPWIDVDRDYPEIYDLCIPFHDLFT